VVYSLLLWSPAISILTSHNCFCCRRPHSKSHLVLVSK
jgi:hypothetical protein